MGEAKRRAEARTVAPIRIAIRGEGEWVNAYLAERETMEDAIHIASMRRAVADAGGFDAFKAMCTELARVIVEAGLGPGVFAGTEEELAPEHERGGHG